MFLLIMGSISASKDSRSMYLIFVVFDKFMFTLLYAMQANLELQIYLLLIMSERSTKEYNLNHFFRNNVSYYFT